MRGLVKLLFSLVVILAIVWLGLWWYAEGRMESGFTAWADRMAAQGWKIGYGADTRGTSPLAATLKLTNLTLSPPPDALGRTVVITLPSLALRIDALNPLLLHTDLPNKIGIDIGTQIDAAVTFGSASETAVLDPHLVFTQQPYPFKSYDVKAASVDILASQGSLLVLHIDNIASHGVVDRYAGAGGTALSGIETFDGIALSPLMTKLLAIPFGGKISHFALGVTVSGPVPAGLQDLVLQLDNMKGDLQAQQKLVIPVLHHWAAAGGNGNMNINLVVGPTTLNAGGAVKFDANAQPAGTADVSADHLDQLTGAITNAYPAAQDQIAQIEAQLSPYLTTTDQGGQSLAAHVVYGDGTVSVNGQKTGSFPPIDWNTLENPPLAPPPGSAAPGDGSGADTPDGNSGAN